MRSALLACLLLPVLCSCADQTGIMVQISSSDLAVPSDIDGLHVRAHTPDGLMLDQTFPLRTTWPHSLLIRPERGEALGEVIVEVTGTHADVFVVRRVVLTAFTSGQVRRVDVELSGTCRNVMCAADVDCVAGHCQGMMADAGMPDANLHDAGTDAPIDEDVGTDGGNDGGNDAGTDANMPCAGASCLGRVVISEMSTYMSNEFVELYNRGGTTADLSGCTLEYFGGTWQPRGTLAAGTTLGPHGFYLLTNVGYTGTPAGDVALWNTGFLDQNAAVRLSCSGTVVDLFGYGAGATQREGTPSPAIDASMIATASYERKALVDSTIATMSAGGRDVLAGNGWDSDDNAADFIIRATRDPQSSVSHEP
jgi:hypothetical protein